MELHQFGDTVQGLCQEGHSLSSVYFGIDDIPYVLKAVDVTPARVTFRLQAETNDVVHTGFLGVGEVNKVVREKSSKSIEKT